MTAEQAHLVVGVAGAAEKTPVEDLVAVYVEVHGDRGEQVTVHVAQHLTLAPAIVHVTYRDHVPLARLELVLYAVLHLLAARFRPVRNDETRAHEEGRVTSAFARAQPVQVGFLLLDLHAAHRVDAKPGRECEAVLVRPVADRWQ